MNSHRVSRRGTTLVELCVVVVVFATLCAIALPRLGGVRDRMSVRAAIQETSALFSLARRSAISRRTLVGVVIDTVAGTVTVRMGPTRIGYQGLQGRYGVLLKATRDSMSFDPRGLGYGAANLTVWARKGRAAESLFVSRLGRTRH